MDTLENVALEGTVGAGPYFDWDDLEVLERHRQFLHQKLRESTNPDEILQTSDRITMATARIGFLILNPPADPAVQLVDDLAASMPVTAHSILNAAAGHMNDRAATYDKPEGERSMASTVGMFNVLTGQDLTEEQGWLFMGLLKMVRAQQGGLRMDSYEDGAAYFALAGEAAARERGDHNA